MSPLRSFRVISALEGASLLLLIGVAMPLKYWLNLPMAVRVVGSVHGLLFLVFVVYLVRCGLEQRWSVLRMAKLLLLSVIPGGVFLIDRMLEPRQKS